MYNISAQNLREICSKTKYLPLMKYRCQCYKHNQDQKLLHYFRQTKLIVHQFQDSHSLFDKLKLQTLDHHF